MKKLAVISTLCLAIIAAILLYNQYSSYKHAKEVERAVSNTEVNRPTRYVADVPRGNTAASETSDQIVVTVDEGGTLRLNSRIVGTVSDTSQLRATLAQIFRERGDQQSNRTVFVKASSRLAYSEVTKVVDAAKGAGADPVALQVESIK